MAGSFIRGAFVELTPALVVPIPNIIVFQFNPETIRHTVSPGVSSASTAGSTASTPAGGGAHPDPLATSGLPGESFGFTLVMDAKEQIIGGSPVTSGLAQATGLYSRLAALELLVFPAESGGGLLGSVSVSVGAGGMSAGGSAGGATSRNVPERRVPTLLFIWGPGRIFPVRVTQLSITETLFDELLNPTHAEAQIELKVLNSDDLRSLTGTTKDIADAAYVYTKVFRQAMATANLANAAESIIGMLPI